MTFNIQHALDYQKQVIDFDLFANTIKRFEADVCGLNEVRSTGPVDGFDEQIEQLGGRLGFYRYFGEAFLVGGNGPYGNGVVSRYPIRSVETIKIPNPPGPRPKPYEPRCVIRAVIDVDGADVCFFICHMGLMPDERENAVATLCRLIDETDLPVVTMGDFNTTPDDPVFAPLFERLEDTDALASPRGVLTHPSYAPTVKIDYILYRGLTCTGVTTITEVISDHFPIVAEFTIPQ